VFGGLVACCCPAPGEHPVCLDLGCGNAALGSLAAARGFDVTAIDGSARMLTLARQAQAHGTDRQIRDFRHAPLPLAPALIGEFHGRAELIIASSVIEYLSAAHARKLLAQCAQLLAPGGTALISFPNRRALYWRAQRLIGARGPLRANVSALQQQQWTPEQVRETARACGLRVDRIEYFALPFQQRLDRLPLGRPRWLATLFVTTLVATG
jgi:SAM-dependent methyltransferase